MWAWFAADGGLRSGWSSLWLVSKSSDGSALAGDVALVVPYREGLLGGSWFDGSSSWRSSVWACLGAGVAAGCRPPPARPVRHVRGRPRRACRAAQRRPDLPARPPVPARAVRTGGPGALARAGPVACRSGRCGRSLQVSAGTSGRSARVAEILVGLPQRQVDLGDAGVALKQVVGRRRPEPGDEAGRPGGLLGVLGFLAEPDDGQEPRGAQLLSLVWMIGEQVRAASSSRTAWSS